MRKKRRKEKAAVAARCRLAAWCEVALFAAILCSPLFAKDPEYPRKTTESILAAQPNKWKRIELVRDYENDQVVSYRWMVHNGRRDRRGPGAYTVSSSCILFAGKEHCTVMKETDDEFEVLIRFEGYDQESTTRIVAKRRSAKVANAWVMIEGKGEIYNEFVTQLTMVQKEADELVTEENRGKQLPKGPGNMLRWLLLSRPVGRVID